MNFIGKINRCCLISCSVTPQCAGSGGAWGGWVLVRHVVLFRFGLRLVLKTQLWWICVDIRYNIFHIMLPCNTLNSQWLMFLNYRNFDHIKLFCAVRPIHLSNDDISPAPTGATLIFSFFYIYIYIPNRLMIISGWHHQVPHLQLKPHVLKPAICSVHAVMVTSLQFKCDLSRIFCGIGSQQICFKESFQKSTLGLVSNQRCEVVFNNNNEMAK